MAFFVKNKAKYPLSILGVTIPVGSKVDLLSFKSAGEIKSAILFGELYYKITGKIAELYSINDLNNIGLSSAELDKLISVGLLNLYDNFNNDNNDIVINMEPFIRSASADGYVSVKNMSSSIVGKTIAPTNSNTYAQWKLNDVLPCANTGVGESLSLVSAAGTQSLLQTPVNRALRIYCDNTNLIQTSSYPTTLPNNTNITISCWVCLNSIIANSRFVHKAYRNDATWATPFSSFGLGLSSTADGSWSGTITVGASLITATTPVSKFKIVINEPTFLAMTYDGINIRLYQNGMLALTQAQSGNIDYGTNGRYLIGCTSAGAQNMDGWISDVRIDNIVKSQNELDMIYKNRMGWN